MKMQFLFSDKDDISIAKAGRVMDEPKQGHPHTDYKGEGHPKPYWKRAHHDWKFWVALTMLLIAMAVYLGTNDLSFRPHGPPRLPTP